MKLNITLFNLLIFIVLTITISCDKDNLGDNTCDVKNPVKDIGWIKNEIEYISQMNPDDYKFISFYMAKYKGESVFYTRYCWTQDEPANPIRNCSNVTIGYYGEILPVDLTEQMVIWKPENCVCVF
jgi:hypothetical protein